MSTPDQLALFLRLMAGFKAIEMRDFLSSCGVEPFGTKHNLAQLIVQNNLEETELHTFVASCSKRARMTVQPRGAEGAGRQGTLDAMWGHT